MLLQTRAGPFVTATAYGASSMCYILWLTTIVACQSPNESRLITNVHNYTMNYGFIAISQVIM